MRVEAYGAVDELNAAIGLAVAHLSEITLIELLRDAQSTLFDLGAELATPDVEQRAAEGKVIARVDAAAVAQLETRIDVLEGELAPLTQFILPGGAPAAAALHLARTVCRRAERRTVTLAASEAVSGEALRYLNRLSDFLFVAARAVNHRAGVEEPRWSPRSPRATP